MIIDAPLPPTPEGMDETAWAAAVAEIRDFCQWHIAPVLPEIVTVDGSGGRLVFLPTLRLVEVTSVTNGGTVLDPVPDSWSENGVLEGGRWSTKRRGIVAEIVHGYEFFPPNVLAVARSLSTAGPNGTPGRRLASGPHSIELDETAAAGPFALSPLHRGVLERYRVRVRP